MFYVCSWCVTEYFNPFFLLSAAASVNGRKYKSLRVMSQKFVMLFLVSTPQIVSLEVAAKILIGEDQLEDLDKSKFKSKYSSKCKLNELSQYYFIERKMLSYFSCHKYLFEPPKTY